MKELKYVHIVQEHLINASREKVFKALTQDTSSWWSHSIEEDSQVRFEAKLGGHFYEEFKQGGGFLYATVIWLKPGEEIELMGPMGWDGPVTGVFSYTLEEKGEGTLVKLEHKFFGPLSGETEGMYIEGWRELLGSNLKNYVEEGRKVR
ncbi:MAG: SRPBCC domain-containing protein [Bdellovibrionota bacterium]